MIIHSSTQKQVGNQIEVSAIIETSAQQQLPQKLWFRYPIQHQYAISDRSDGFASCLSVLAMFLGEDIEVRGVMSTKLSENLPKMMALYQKAHPKLLQPVALSTEHTSAASQCTAEQQGIQLASFSGGVDSLYVLWSHLHPEKSPHPAKLSHGLFIHGYDLSLQNQANYQRFAKEYRQLFADFGLGFIEAQSNAYEFYKFRTPWEFSNLPSLVGTVQTLGRAAVSFIQPGNTEPSPEAPKRPSTSIGLFSTESLQFSAHGTELGRSVKLISLLEWPVAQQHLRVCKTMRTKPGAHGCQRCSKCLNTRMFLYLYEAQEHFPNFSEPFTMKDFIRHCLSAGDLFSIRKTKYFKILKQKRPDFWLVYWLLQPFGFLKSFIERVIIPNMPQALLRGVKAVVYREQY